MSWVVKKYQLKEDLYWKESQKNTKFKTLANRGGGGVLPAIVFQNLSWTPKTCFAFSLDWLLFISSKLDDFESNPMFIYVASQRWEQPKYVQY